MADQHDWANAAHGNASCGFDPGLLAGHRPPAAAGPAHDTDGNGPESLDDDGAADEPVIRGG